MIAPERDYRVDVDALLSRVTERTRFCTIANPNNPTGTYLDEPELRRLHAGLPEDCLFLIDDAYAEYVTAPDYVDGAALVDEFDNVVMTRTFSKIYGLPSLRIGWAYCPAGVFDLAQRIRTPFNTNGPALAAATANAQDELRKTFFKEADVAKAAAEAANAQLLAAVTYYDKDLERLVQQRSSGGGCGNSCSSK